MKFSQRTAGIKVARQVFKRAREDERIGHQVKRGESGGRVGKHERRGGGSICVYIVFRKIHKAT